MVGCWLLFACLFVFWGGGFSCLGFIVVRFSFFGGGVLFYYLMVVVVVVVAAVVAVAGSGSFHSSVPTHGVCAVPRSPPYGDTYHL